MGSYNPPMRLGRRRLWGRLRLSRQILLLQLAIIVITLGTGLVVSIIAARDQLDKQSGRQSLSIARTLAQMPGIAAALSSPPSPHGVVQRAAERIRHATDASFVVVADRRGDPVFASERLEDRQARLDRFRAGARRPRVRRRPDGL